MGTDRRHDVGIQQRAALKRYPLEARKLPPAGEEWLGSDIGIDRGAIRLFSHVGVIQKRRYDGPHTNRHWWETSEKVVEWVDRYLKLEHVTPCGHATGVRTITAGEEYTCTCDDCDCRMDRETAEEVVA